MLNHLSVTAFELVRGTTSTLLNLAWNTFKTGLSIVLALLAWFAAWGAWQNGVLTLGAVIVPLFLLALASAPWVIPALSTHKRER